MRERICLYKRFEGRLSVNPSITSNIISYRGNRDAPGFRWMKYKEGFSTSLVESLIGEIQPSSVLDPFSGIGTTPLVAAGMGLRATGIEILPVAVLVGRAIALAANGLRRDAFIKVASAMLKHLRTEKQAGSEHAFPHVGITEYAFPSETELELAKAREFISIVDDHSIQTMLNLACMSVLESVSYTRKDGQYLRWYNQSRRNVKTRAKKSSIPRFINALDFRLSQMAEDIIPLTVRYGSGESNLIAGSTLEHLRRMPEASFDLVITSPPYPNRYDYTRIYALELAWLGYNQDAIKSLRQELLSATVENRSKIDWLVKNYRHASLLPSAIRMYEQQSAMHEALNILRSYRKELSNPNVIRMLEGYFIEMAIVVAELGRIVSPAGNVIVVSDNVQYHGEEFPVDFILSDFAEQSGFECKHIWTLPRGKGNSSQQMGRFGRRELRKCVYWWSRLK